MWRCCQSTNHLQGMTQCTLGAQLRTARPLQCRSPSSSLPNCLVMDVYRIQNDVPVRIKLHSGYSCASILWVQRYLSQGFHRFFKLLHPFHLLTNIRTHQLTSLNSCLLMTSPTCLVSIIYGLQFDQRHVPHSLSIIRPQRNHPLKTQ